MPYRSHTGQPAYPLVLMITCMSAVLLAAEPAPSGDALGPGLIEDAGLSLHAAFDAAWSRWPARRMIEAKAAASDAYLEQSESLLAAPPELLFRHQNDLLHDRQGLTEAELGVDFPFWRPGQRRKVREQAEAYRETVAADEAVQQWELAGSLRESFWQVHLARVNLTQSQQTLSHFRSLEDEVARRMAAGDAAEQDLILAGTERSLREADLSTAYASLLQTEQEWLKLTGLDHIPVAATEAIDKAAPPAYPPLTSALRLLDERAAALDTAKAAGAGTPRVLIGTRVNTLAHERTQTVTGAQFSIPFGGEGHQAAMRAPLVLAHGEALSEVQRLELEFDKVQRLAERELRSAERLLREAEARLRLVERHSDLTRRAYALGEAELVQRILSEQRLSEARLRRAQSQLLVQRALSRKQHVVGVLP